MLFNYLKISFRSLFRNKLYTAINILGLTVGLACVLLIALYILDELTFDRFHQKADRIYRVLETKTDPNKGDATVAAVPYSIAGAAVKDLPEVENSLTIAHLGRGAISYESTQQSFYEQFFLATPTFFDLFDYKLIQGDAETCLEAPETAIISSELAKKFFGDDEAMGQTLTTDRGINVTITGVYEPMPSNSHLQFNILFSLSTLYQYEWFEQYEAGDWTSNDWLHYFLLEPNVDAAETSSKITAMVADHQEEESEFNSIFQLQPLQDIHFHSHGFESDLNENKGSLSYVYIFMIVGFFVMLIACINYMNLATSRSSTYGKEVGVRKVVGANRSTLVSRFFSETIIICGIAFIFALNVAHLLLPAFNTFTGKDLSLGITDSSYILPLLLGIIMGVGLLAGIYPSLYFSRFNPVQVLKGVLNKDKKQFNLRKSLVVFQFVLSIIMIISTGIAFSQMQYIQNKNLGFNEDHLIVVDINSGKVRAGYKTIKENYEKLASVKDVSVSSRVPGEWKVLPKVTVAQPGNANSSESIEPYFIGADEDFLATFEIELLKGRSFDPERADSTAVMINEAAAKLLGIEEPGDKEYIVSKINFDGMERELSDPFRFRVVGITKDFHFQSLHERINPMIIGYRNNPMHRIDYFTARVSAQDIDATIAQMETILHSVDPGHLFEYHFLDDQLQQFYENDQRRSNIFSMAALLAIFIACLGLFGLSAFAAEQRTKEIGIRKVLGASIVNLIGLLSKDFLRLVGIAIIIAIPLAWYIARRWLQNFAYSVDLSWWMFIVPGMVAILIALLTVSFQSVKVAISNPVKALRWE